MLPAQIPTPGTTAAPVRSDPGAAATPSRLSSPHSPASPLPPNALPEGIDKITADAVLAYYLEADTTTLAEIAESIANRAAIPGMTRTGQERVRQLSVRAIGEILESPYGKEVIALIERLADQRTRIINAEMRTQAIFTLQRIACNSDNEALALRAAIALLRSPGPSRTRTTFSGDSDPSPRTRRRESDNNNDPFTYNFRIPSITRHLSTGLPRSTGLPTGVGRPAAAPPQAQPNASAPTTTTAPVAPSPATGGGGNVEAQLQRGGGVSTHEVEAQLQQAPSTPTLPSRSNPKLTPELKHQAKQALALLSEQLLSSTAPPRAEFATDLLTRAGTTTTRTRDAPTKSAA